MSDKENVDNIKLRFSSSDVKFIIRSVELLVTSIVRSFDDDDDDDDVKTFCSKVSLMSQGVRIIDVLKKILLEVSKCC